MMMRQTGGRVSGAPVRRGDPAPDCGRSGPHLASLVAAGDHPPGSRRLLDGTTNRHRTPHTCPAHGHRNQDTDADANVVARLSGHALSGVGLRLAVEYRGATAAGLPDAATGGGLCAIGAGGGDDGRTDAGGIVP